MGSMDIVAKPKVCTQVVIPWSKVHVDPSGGVTGGAADAEAGRPIAATAATTTPAHQAFLHGHPSRSPFAPNR
jgi:hypothetical protein